MSYRGRGASTPTPTPSASATTCKYCTFLLSLPYLPTLALTYKLPRLKFLFTYSTMSAPPSTWTTFIITTAKFTLLKFNRRMRNTTNIIDSSLIISMFLSEARFIQLNNSKEIHNSTNMATPMKANHCRHILHCIVCWPQHPENLGLISYHTVQNK